jgi:hypothetical protein
MKKQGTLLISNNITNEDIMSYVNEDLVTEEDIEKAIEDLVDINNDLNTMINQQETKINEISSNIQESHKSLEVATSQLEDVFKLDKRNTIIYIGASVGGIIGSLIPFLQSFTIPSGILLGGYIANKLV